MIGRNNFVNASEEEQREIIQAGMDAHINLDEEQRAQLTRGQNKGRDFQQQQAMIKYCTPGKPAIVPDNKLWECTGNLDGVQPCRFSCMSECGFLSFVNVPELSLLTWLVDHKLMDTNCNRRGCDGECKPIAINDLVGLKCLKEGCGFISKGGKRGFFRNSRITYAQMMSMMFIIVTGGSYLTVKTILRLKINKNTWTSYVKDVGMVVGEALERNRRDDRNRYSLAQWDETAFGKRVTITDYDIKYT